MTEREPEPQAGNRGGQGYSGKYISAFLSMTHDTCTLHGSPTDNVAFSEREPLPEPQAGNRGGQGYSGKYISTYCIPGSRISITSACPTFH